MWSDHNTTNKSLNNESTNQYALSLKHYENNVSRRNVEYRSSYNLFYTNPIPISAIPPKYNSSSTVLSNPMFPGP